MTAARTGAPESETKPEATSLLGVPLYAPALAPERKKALDADLEKATAEFVKSPDSADAAVWLGRRYAYLGRYRDAIDAFTSGLARHPNDARLLRHRGHRYVSVRELDKAARRPRARSGAREGHEGRARARLRSQGARQRPRCSSGSSTTWGSPTT